MKSLSKTKKRLITIFVALLIALFAYFAITKIFAHQLVKYFIVDATNDVVIHQNEYLSPEDGYATIFDEFYFNIEKRKMYHVQNYHVWSPAARATQKGDHYSLVSKKNLSELEKNSLLEILSNIAYQTSLEELRASHNLSDIQDYYYSVDYHNDSFYLNTEATEILEKIIK